MRKPFTWSLAALLGAIHLVFVMGPFFTSGGGEGAVWRLFFLDLPLSAVLEATGLLERPTAATLIYALFGTAMYAAPGALIGYAIDRLRYEQGLESHEAKRD